MRTDQSLIDETLAGDSSAFDVLVLRYQDRLVHSLEHALGSQDEAADIAQQTFVQAWRRLSTFRAESAFYTWLYRIARNIAAGRHQRQRLALDSLDGLAEAGGFEPVDQRPSSRPDHQLNQSEQDLVVRNALQQIAEEFRLPLVMKEPDGFSYDEISRILDVPPGTVRSRIFRARQELADRLRRLQQSE